MERRWIVASAAGWLVAMLLVAMAMPEPYLGRGRDVLGFYLFGLYALVGWVVPIWLLVRYKRKDRPTDE